MRAGCGDRGRQALSQARGSSERRAREAEPSLRAMLPGGGLAAALPALT